MALLTLYVAAARRGIVSRRCPGLVRTPASLPLLSTLPNFRAPPGKRNYPRVENLGRVGTLRIGYRLSNARTPREVKRARPACKFFAGTLFASCRLPRCCETLSLSHQRQRRNFQSRRMCVGRRLFLARSTVVSAMIRCERREGRGEKVHSDVPHARGDRAACLPTKCLYEQMFTHRRLSPVIRSAPPLHYCEALALSTSTS